MEQIIASVFFDKFFYYIGNIIFCIFKNFELHFIIIAARVYKLRLVITARVYKLRLAEANFLSCYTRYS